MSDREQAIRAELIRRSLGGQHLTGWLPGHDHKDAISHMVSGRGGGSLLVGDEHLAHQTTAKGLVAAENYRLAQEPKGAIVFVSWSELADVIAKGVTPQRAAELKRTLEAWSEWHRADFAQRDVSRKRETPGQRRERIHTRFECWQAVEHPYDEARSAIIEAGIAAELAVEPELTLF